MAQINYIDEVEITHKRVLVRVDYNVSMKDDVITDDTRIKASIQTINLLLNRRNRLILMSHLGKPKGKDPQFSMAPIAKRLQEYLSGYKVVLIRDLLTDFSSFTSVMSDSSENKTVFLLENTRFYEGEKKNDPEFARRLSELADVFVNDAFGCSHRNHASVVGVARLLPSYGGLLLKKEINSILQAIESPKKPVVAIIGGAKVSTKIGVLEKLMTVADTILIGGAMTNNFLKAKGLEVGKGLVENEYISEAQRILEKATKEGKNIVLPIDLRVGSKEDTNSSPIIKKVTEITSEEEQLDIGPETEKIFSEIIAQAETIVWNGPVGYFENPQFSKGSKAIYKAIVSNTEAVSVVGGGDTLSLIKNEPDKEKITHISTGGGAMLELIEKGTLPGIEALRR